MNNESKQKASKPIESIRDFVQGQGQNVSLKSVEHVTTDMVMSAVKDECGDGFSIDKHVNTISRLVLSYDAGYELGFLAMVGTQVPFSVGLNEGLGFSTLLSVLNSPDITLDFKIMNPTLRGMQYISVTSDAKHVLRYLDDEDMVGYAINSENGKFISLNDEGNDFIECELEAQLLGFPVDTYGAETLLPSFTESIVLAINANAIEALSGMTG